MTKFMAVLRTLFFVGIVGYMVWALPWGLIFSSAATRDAACFKVPDLDKVASGAWLAIGWIGLETVLGWIRVGLAGRAELKAERLRNAAEVEKLKAAAAARPPPAGSPPSPAP